METKKYYEEKHFHMAYKRLVMATEWISPEGETVKLTHNMKAVYHHKMEQYTSFNNRGLPYHESHQTVADKLGLTAYTVKKVIIPLLKRMGLIELKKITTRRYETTMYPLKFMAGRLINSKLEKHHKKKVGQYEKKAPMTHEEFQTINSNKAKIKKVQQNLKQEVVIMTKEDFDKLMSRNK